MMRGVITHLLKRRPAQSQVRYAKSAISGHKSSTWQKHRIFATTVDLGNNDNESIVNLADILEGSD
jgi:hypothetical protein